jgi:hypothetical protein
MGERITPECDIFKTLQPKGLRILRVLVTEQNTNEGVGVDSVLVDAAVAVGERGKKRVIRIAQNAIKPYASTREAEANAPGA